MDLLKINNYSYLVGMNNEYSYNVLLSKQEK